MSFSRWKLEKYDAKAIETLARELKLSRLAAAVLTARGHATPELAREFLEQEYPLEDAVKLADAEKAAARINAAIENDERIAVFGDYDVDGITATALMWLFLQGSGADVVCSLPTRETSGYGITKEAIDNLKKYDVSLIITVDNGISAYDEIEYANALGMETIICDHHLPPGQLPNAAAVVNPLRLDDGSRFKELAGVGVALKLCAAVEGCSVEELLNIYGYLAAIGTISDIMPLIGENRTIVKNGLAQLREGENPGLAALCQAADINLDAIDAGGVAFGISPRLNAAGRLDTADTALRLLITEDMEEARQIAEQLVALNIRRRDIESEVSARIEEEIARNPHILKEPIIVVAVEELHSGVSGIVCSRLVDRYNKPAIIISIEGEDAKGSGRSVPGFSLHEAITACGDLLIKYGGHEMAAGLTIKVCDIERLKARLFDYCRAQKNGLPLPAYRVDTLVELGDIDEQSVAELEQLAPFGCGNEEPVFGICGAELTELSPLNDRHSRLTLKKDGGTLSGVLFGQTPKQLKLKPGQLVDAAFSLSIYRGARKDSVSVRFRSFRDAGIGETFFDSIKAYRDFCAGHSLSEDSLRLVFPGREGVARVYRELKQAPLDPDDYPDLRVRVPELFPGQIAAATDILFELGLIKYIMGKATPTDNPDKKQLENSAIYRQLCEESDGIQRTETTNHRERQGV